MKTTEMTYFEPSYVQRLRVMVQGLRMPQGTREHKAAMIELQRLSAPLTAAFLPVLLATVLMVLGGGDAGVDKMFTPVILEPDVVKPLEKLDDPKPPEPTPDDFVVPTENPVVEVTQRFEDTKFSPVPQKFDAVQVTISPAIFKGIFGDSRNAGARGDSLRKFNRSGIPTEDAVLRALRWLKLKQDRDGSWGGNRIAMTSLAVLTFLAHDETPDPEKSPEFCATVENALEYLLSKQKEDGRFMGKDGNDYSHPIATYALAEAYGMTLNPNVRAAVEKALVPLIRGQHPTGGWTYNMNPGQETGGDNPGAYRDDTSYMGWCAQALKAAKLARIPAEGLDKAMKMAVRGFKSNAAPGGGFGYTSPGAGGLTAVGTLCLQLLGAADDRDAKLSLDLMKPWRPSFADKADGIGNSLQYYYYYATQAKFHAYAGNSPEWDKWNNVMSALYVAEQKIEKAAIKGPDGKDCDVGWWENNDNHTDRPVMDTCLSALQLMVYYRHLPTTRAAAVQVEEELNITPNDEKDIEIQIVGM